MAEVDVVTGASENPDLKSDAHASSTDFEAGPNQGIGISENGINDVPIVVRVTMSGDKISQIETLQEKETPYLGGKAIPVLTNEMIEKQTTEVDAVSGASTTSAAFKEAVNQAIENVEKQ